MNLNASAESIMMLLARNPPASIRLRFGVCLQFGSFDGGHRAAPGGTGRQRAVAAVALSSAVKSMAMSTSSYHPITGHASNTVHNFNRRKKNQKENTKHTA